VTEATFPCITCEKQGYPVLAPLSAYYSRYEDRLSTRYSPVRHSTCFRRNFRVRLACVKHAASVCSEPGSNSPVQYPSQSQFDWTNPNQNQKYLARSVTVQFSKIKSSCLSAPSILPDQSRYVKNYFSTPPCSTTAAQSLATSNEATPYKT
jgi:hypothetical protein